MTKKEKSIRRWGFASAFLETLLNTKLFIYQIWFFYSFFVLANPIGFFTIEAILLEHIALGVFVTIATIFIIMLVVEVFFPHMAVGAIIGLAAKSYKKEELRGGMVLALYNFLPIFVARELFFFAKGTTVITIISLVLRYGELKGFSITILVCLFVFSNILKFLASFTEEAIVIRKLNVFNAMGKSFKLVISYLGHVVFLLILVFVISLRIFINAAMFLLVPGIVLGVGLLLASFLPPILSWSLAIVAGFLLILLASYFFAYLEVFRQTVWTITYLELSSRKELDVIEEEQSTIQS